MSNSESDTSLEIPQYDTQFVSQEDDDDNLWEVIEILAERGARYKVNWAGVDPATGKPWPPSWVPKQDCTDKLIQDWKIKQAKLKKKQVKSRASTTTSRASKNSMRTTTSTSRVTRSRSSLTPALTSLPNKTVGSARPSLLRLSHVEVPSRQLSLKYQVSESNSLNADRESPIDEDVPPRKRRKANNSSDPGVTEAEFMRHKGKRKVIVMEEEESSTDGLLLPPITKVGPPRHAKRKRTRTPSPKMGIATEAEAVVEETSDESVFWDNPFEPPDDDPQLAHDTFSREGIVPETQSFPSSLSKHKHGDSGNITKPLRPVPVLSPSAFRAYLPEPQAPPSSIEQFSSPEKSAGTPRRRTSATRDAELWSHQQEFAVRSAIARRKKELRDAQLLIGRPSKATVLSTAHARKQAASASIEQFSSQRPVREDIEEASREHTLAQEMEDAYVDLSGGEQHNHSLPNAQKSLQDRHPYDTNVTDHQDNAIEPPPTASTQQADVDSQSLPPSFPASQIRELTIALNEKSEEVIALTAKLDEFHAQMVYLKAEHQRLTEQYAASLAQSEVQGRLLTDAEASNTRLDQRIVDLEQRFVADKAQLMAELDVLQVSLADTERRKADAEKDRELFRGLYGQASAFTDEIRKTNEELQTRTIRAEGQVVDGLLIMKHAYEEKVRALEEEVQKWKTSCNILTEKDLLTNDDIRRQAALAPELSNENRSLQETVDRLTAECGRLECLLQPDESEVDDRDGLDVESVLGVEGERGGLQGHSENSDMLYVCQYVTDGSLCLTTSSDLKGFKQHVYTHYPPPQDCEGIP